MDALNELAKRKDDNGANWVFYAYKPSHTMPWVCLAVFALITLVHTYWLWRTRCIAYLALVLGCAAETAGYGVRVISINNPVGKSQGLGPYLGTSLCIILAPVAIALSEYQVFGRLILYVGEQYSPIRANRVTYTFITFDIVSFVVQGAGGSLFSSDKRSVQNAAKAILDVGFIIQIVSFGIFLICAIIYWVRARRAGVHGKYEMCLITLWVACALILVRSVYRVLEFSTGTYKTGYLLTHEAWYYGLEALPVVIACSVLGLSHPALYIPSSKAIRMADVEPFGSPSVTAVNSDVGVPAVEGEKKTLGKGEV